MKTRIPPSHPSDPTDQSDSSHRSYRSHPSDSPVPPTRSALPGSPPLLRLRGAGLAETTAFMQRAGHPAYRAKQLFQWVFEKGARDFSEMTNLAKPLREWLADNYDLGGMKRFDLVGPEGETQKLVFQTDDGKYVETVLMRDEPDSDEPDDSESPEQSPGSRPQSTSSTPPVRKVSLCVSSQIGCPLGCTFCMTGHGGYRRNLRTDEIVDQVLTARRLISRNTSAAGQNADRFPADPGAHTPPGAHAGQPPASNLQPPLSTLRPPASGLQPPERIANLVFMGMGEPMLNLAAVIPALRLIVSPQALGFATRRVTVSTVGVIEGIDEFARAATETNLAVSLNATTQAVRDRIMPACKKWPLSDLLAACRRYPLTKRRRITFEYVLLKGVNDTWDDAKRLTKILRGIPCKINLILYNPADPLPFRPTDEARAEEFRSRLAASDYTASLRRSKGRAYAAACGQLAAHARNRVE